MQALADSLMLSHRLRSPPEALRVNKCGQPGLRAWLPDDPSGQSKSPQVLMPTSPEETTAEDSIVAPFSYRTAHECIGTLLRLAR
jgi:hypothetical protein